MCNSAKKNGAKTLILYDSHKSHIRLTLVKWAEKKNVILFVLPPQYSHLTQPLDVGIFGPFKSMYYHECRAYMKQNPGLNINRYNVAELTAKPYIGALRSENLISAFRKSGVHPFNRNVISASQVAPAVIYKETDSTAHCLPSDSQETIPYGNSDSEAPEEAVSTIGKPDAQQFFEKRAITAVVPKPKERKFVPPFIVGSLLKKSNITTLEQVEEKKGKLPPKENNWEPFRTFV